MKKFAYLKYPRVARFNAMPRVIQDFLFGPVSLCEINRSEKLGTIKRSTTCGAPQK